MLEGFSAVQLAAWGALTGTAGLAVSLVVAYFNIRKALREAPRLRIDRASPGAQYNGELRWDNVSVFVINEGGATVSITDYWIEIYERRWRWWLRRPTRKVRGDGFELRAVEGRLSSCLPSNKSPPLPLKSGEPMRLDIYDPGFWPDKRWRKVQVFVRYSPPRAVARFLVEPEAHNYSDPDSQRQARREISEALARALAPTTA